MRRGGCTSLLRREFGVLVSCRILCIALHQVASRAAKASFADGKQGTGRVVIRHRHLMATWLSDLVVLHKGFHALSSERVE